MAGIGRRAREAAPTLSLAPAEVKVAGLHGAAKAVRARADEILAANARDLAEAESQGVSAALRDRLALDPGRIEGIAAAVNPSGTVIVDDGAAGALRRGTSLLPAGVVAVEGTFERGDAVIIRSRGGAETGRGLSAYSSADIRRIAGHKSGEIADILGYRGRDEIIHRDDLVVTEPR